MIKLFFILLITTVALTSCGQNNNKIEDGQAIFFFNSINDDIDASVEVEQRLIDTATQIILTLKSDSLVSIDVKSFKILLDSAKAANQIAENKVKEKAEVDEEINYKQKAIDYLRLFDTLYHEFGIFVNFLEQKQENRFSKAAALIVPTLKMIKEKELIFKDAKQSFKDKYPTDENGNVRSKPDFEYVKLSDFHYEQANIKEEEEIRLLSFSGGGKNCTDETIYYRQFIGIQKSTGDTIRILSACQEYDLNKAEKIGYFYKDSAIPVGNIKRVSADNSFIVFNKHQTIFEKRNYKTIIGSLGFKE